MRKNKCGVRLTNVDDSSVYVYFEDLDDRNKFLQLLNYGFTKASITLFEVSEKQEAI